MSQTQQSSGPTPDQPSSRPLAAEPTSPTPQPDATAIDAWRHAVAAWLAEHQTYPDEARRQGTEGTVTLRLSVDRAGHVIDLTVLRGSGSRILDGAAEAMLGNARLPPPALAMQDRITIPVQAHYRLTR